MNYSLKMFNDMQENGNSSFLGYLLACCLCDSIATIIKGNNLDRFSVRELNSPCPGLLLGIETFYSNIHLKITIA